MNDRDAVPVHALECPLCGYRTATDRPSEVQRQMDRHRQRSHPDEGSHPTEVAP